MSGYDPRWIKVFPGTDTTGKAVCLMECAACDPLEPRAVKMWTAQYDLYVLDIVARRHWSKWHQG